MLFTHSHVDRNAVVVRLGNKTITQVKSVKFLGIHSDDRLNYNDQTCVLSKKLSRAIGIMFKLSAFVPPYIIRIIYFSLFYSHLIYGITVWGGCGVSNINKIIKLHKRAISLCANNHSRNSLLQYSSVYSYFTLIRFQKISIITTVNTLPIKYWPYFRTIHMRQDSLKQIKLIFQCSINL